jgi:methylated-DNA-[protein]-cysteine S-methyltransferase
MGYALFDTALGAVGVAWSDRGLTAVQLPERNARATEQRLAERSGATPAAPPPAIRKVMRDLAAHLSGRRRDFSKAQLDLSDQTEFRRRVYEALRRVAPGSTVSYAQLAEMCGSPGAARAIGQCMGHNPMPLVVPCHRVLAAGGRAGGFSAAGGVATKQRLLAIEGVRIATGKEDRPEPGRLPFSARAAVNHLRRADPRMEDLIGRAGPLRLELAPEAPFVYLLRAIVYQQLTGKAAATIHGRVLEECGCPPRARRLLAVAEQRLRAAGLSRSKVLAVQDLARRSVERRLPTRARLTRMEDEEIVERLSEVRGIGRWSAQMLLMFNLGRPDVLPVGDYGVLKGFGILMGAKQLPGPERLERRAERWRPYRSVASWYLWRAVDLAQGKPMPV